MTATHPDAFARLAMALREILREPTQAISVDDARTRNLLLDACGSDYRTLVELTLSVEPLLRVALAGPRGTPTNGHAAWETYRAPLVHRLVATRYLQPDIARWLVDTWAYVLDVRAELPHAPSVQHAQVDTRADATAHADAHADAHASSHPARGSRAAVRSNTSGTTTRGAATWSGAHATPSPAANPLPGWAVPKSSLGRPVRATASRMTPAELARIKRIERVSLVVLAASVIVGFAAEGWALYSRPVDRLPFPTPVQNDAPMVSLPTGAGNAFAPTRLSPQEPLVTASAAVPAVDGTVAGTYRVEHSQVSVGGSDGCEAVAGALALQQPSIEVVAQSVGSSTVQWVSRGIRGVIEPDGRFITGPDSGVTDGVRWTFTMTGRFSRDGFSAQAQKTTDAVLGWHKSRSCSVVATLTGTRVGG